MRHKVERNCSGQDPQAHLQDLPSPGRGLLWSFALLIPCVFVRLVWHHQEGNKSYQSAQRNLLPHILIDSNTKTP
jgi:hypothetical protein